MVQSSFWWLPWVALASAAGIVPAVLAWRKQRRAAAVRWLGWATLPWAAWLLGLFPLVSRVADAFADWSARFVFNPAAWVGIVLAVVGVALIVGGGRLGARRATGEASPRRKPADAAEKPARGQVAASKDPADDDIEAILRKHGIT
jgi:hypothetical protein